MYINLGLFAFFVKLRGRNVASNLLATHPPPPSATCNYPAHPGEVKSCHPCLSFVRAVSDYIRGKDDLLSPLSHETKEPIHVT